MSTETIGTELVPVEQVKEYATPAERLKSAEMPVLRRTPQELAAEQEACNLILQQVLGSNSLLIPEDLRKDPKAVLTLIAYARDFGIHYQEVLQNAFCVKNKISFNTKFLITQLRRRFSVQPFYTWSGSGDDRTCTVQFFDLTRVDQNGDPVVIKGIEYSMTMKQGLASGWGGDPWKKQPEKMLMYRTAKIAIDTHWPGILGFDSGEREEYVEWANAAQHTPTDGIRAVKIMGPIPVDPKLEKLLAAPVPAEKPQPAVVSETKTPVLVDPLLFDTFKTRLDASESQADAKDIWEEIKAAFDRKSLLADERDELKDIYAAKYRSLGLPLFDVISQEIATTAPTRAKSVFTRLSNEIAAGQRDGKLTEDQAVELNQQIKDRLEEI